MTHHAQTIPTVRPTIQATGGCDKAEDVTVDNIRAVRVRFTPSPYMERKLQPGAEGMTFTKVEDSTTTFSTTETT